MAGRKVGSLDIQFGPEFDKDKANQLVQSLQKVISALNALVLSQSQPAPAAGVAKHELADTTGLGPAHTVSGLSAGEVIVATSPASAHFDFLEFGQLKHADAGTFAAPVNGDVIAFINGYWSAVPNTFGLANPGIDAVILWDVTANGGAGGLTWALPGSAIAYSPGRIGVDPTQIDHSVLENLTAGYPHPQYLLAGQAAQLAVANTFNALNTFLAGLISAGDITLSGNLEQFGIEGVEDRIQNVNDLPNEGTWRMHVEPGQEMWAAVNDDGSDAENWLTVTRVADVVDTVNVQANALTFNGGDVCCGSLVPGAGAVPATIAGYLTITVGGQTIKVPYLAS